MRLALMVYGCREGRDPEQGIACPMCDSEWITCVHPMLDRDDDVSVVKWACGDGSDPAPDWCPLKDRPLTLHRYGGES